MRRPAKPSRAPEARRASVRERYGTIAAGGGCCTPAGGTTSGCCGAGGCSGSGDAGAAPSVYPPGALDKVPSGADLGLGCGHPTALLALEAGQTVLDLGSGAGVDCFLAADQVGRTGRVVGVDMTPAMLARARQHAERGGYANVEFRLGEIEHLPVADRSVDVVISNCVLNLSPEKEAVFREAYRVLRPGGRLAVSDIVATRPIAPEERSDPGGWSDCRAGAIAPGEVARLLRRAGFRSVRVGLRHGGASAPPTGLASADIRARKPAG